MPRELGLVELEDPLEQRVHVRRQLARERPCELSLVGVGVLRPPLHLEVVAQHVHSKGDEAMLGGGGDQQHVLLAAQRRQLGLARRGVAWPHLAEEVEQHLEEVARRLELQVERLVELGGRRAHLAMQRGLYHPMRLVVHVVHAVQEPLHVGELHRRIHGLHELEDSREQQHLQLVWAAAGRRLGLHLGGDLAEQRRGVGAVGLGRAELDRQLLALEARLELGADGRPRVLLEARARHLDEVEQALRRDLRQAVLALVQAANEERHELLELPVELRVRGAKEPLDGDRRGDARAAHPRGLRAARGGALLGGRRAQQRQQQLAEDARAKLAVERAVSDARLVAEQREGRLDGGLAHGGARVEPHDVGEALQQRPPELLRDERGALAQLREVLEQAIRRLERDALVALLGCVLTHARDALDVVVAKELAVLGNHGLYRREAGLRHGERLVGGRQPEHCEHRPPARAYALRARLHHVAEAAQDELLDPHRGRGGHEVLEGLEELALELVVVQLALFEKLHRELAQRVDGVERDAQVLVLPHLDEKLA
mmetsp:Transcript_17970/g.42655  ORF Transcript_17970/g.42655 Transcript_17970/m.42655 type:complete len:544 (+) Transcript_17970:270-1901(+)